MEQDILELYNSSVDSISNRLEDGNFQDKIDNIRNEKDNKTHNITKR
ncbi:MAG: hypothetical protein ACK4IX_15550 [Candidatus Sericytochromatia bacterium]